MRIARKEFAAFFSSPAAFIFLGAFLGVTLFIFFWVERFFARNLADVRPLFSWMPILLIFLTASITMRLWSEERRAGTLEFLLTSPVKPVWLVLGKFLACLGLVGVALGLTLPLPLTVSVLGPLDWGPVLGGYLAAFFLASVYIAVGLYASSRAENQIVSLISAVFLCSALYLLGSDTLTGLFGNRMSEILRLLGSGSRFESITRGVIDLRDLIYYVSLVGVFLSLNVYSLERLRWAGNRHRTAHRQWGLLTLLLIANLIGVNIWLAPVNQARLDCTQGRIYSISDATRAYLRQLREPLLIRGYFSARTHPLLAPLVPRLRDLLKEYQIAGRGRVRVEFVDPLTNPELEQEAGQKYGIKPVPFETTSKYQASVTNSYFDILIKYGDQFETLGFRDLIEVKESGTSDIAVDLRNPEYDITRAIKKVLLSYQGSGNLFVNIAKPVVFKAFLSADDKLPKELVNLKKELQDIIHKFNRESNGKITLKIIDPESNGGRTAEQLTKKYGFQPMTASLFSANTFWFYMIMENGEKAVQVPLPGGLNSDALERSIKAALKRFSSGFLKTVAVSAPPFRPPMPQYGIPGSGKSFQWLRDKLGEEHSIVDTDLKQGRVPDEADLLLLLSPEKFNQKQLFAVDQFLMRGGTVVMATSPIDITMQDGLNASEHHSGLSDWLAHNGISIKKGLVLDRQNSAFPVPVKRRLGGFIVQETRMINYPFFVDIRDDGMDRQSGLTAGINQISMSWPSPVVVDRDKNKNRSLTVLLQSSPHSWWRDSLDIQPDFKKFGNAGFPEDGKLKRQALAVMITGKFDSWFKGKPSPLRPEKAEKGAQPKNHTNKVKKNGREKPKNIITKVLEKSPESARIILFASNTFLSDTALQLASGAMGTRYEGPVQLVANVVDWSLEDRGLLAIRGRGHFARTLSPMASGQRLFWEYLNYFLAAFGLAIIWILKAMTRKRAKTRYRLLLQEGRAYK